MTSYEFEVAAKNAVIEVIREFYGYETDIKRLQLVWFAHILGHKKAIIFELNDGSCHIFEVTYDREKNNMYVDSYIKKSNTVLVDIDTAVHE